MDNPIIVYSRLVNLLFGQLQNRSNRYQKLSNRDWSQTSWLTSQLVGWLQWLRAVLGSFLNAYKRQFKDFWGEPFKDYFCSPATSFKNFLLRILYIIRDYLFLRFKSQVFERLSNPIRHLWYSSLDLSTMGTYIDLSVERY